SVTRRQDDRIHPLVVTALPHVQAKFQLIQQNSDLADSLDVFAVGKGGGYRSFAYDQTVDAFYGSPADPADAQGRALMLGMINTTTGQFTRVSALIDAGGNGLTAGANDRAYIAGDNFAGGRLFITTGDGQLFQFVTATGALTKVGDILENGSAVTLVGLDVDDTTGNLVAIDPILNRVVEIDTATAQVSSRSGNGLVPQTLADLSYNAISNTFFGFVPDTQTFVSMANGAVLGGLIAHSIDTMTVSGAFGAIVNTTGNTFGSVTINGNFTGVLDTAGSIRSLSITGTMGGAVLAGGDISTYTQRGNVTDAGIIDAAGKLGTFTNTGDFNGRLTAGETGTISISGNVGTGAVIDVAGNATGLTVNGNFAGMGEFGWMSGALNVRGILQTGGSLAVLGDVAGVTFTGGTEAGTSLIVSGRGTTLSVGMIHRGTIAYQLGLTSATLKDVNIGLLDVGMDLGTLSVSGESNNAVYSIGTWIGADGIYNTADDVITGGALRSARFTGRFIDSVLAVGVLPPQADGPGLPADNRGYVGFTVDGDFRDAAEAGGLLPSRLDSATFSGRIETTQIGGARQSVLAVAGYLGRVSTNTTGAALAQRQYTDPAGAPTVLSHRLSSDSTIEINFSEALNRNSIRLSTAPGDGGTITALLDGVQLTNLTLRYFEYTDSNGILRRSAASRKAPPRLKAL
ncbi:MAG: hypothetical protein HC898_00330, partial [Phycisphaerales bacterium]|nr:hypothetical protein [Phycisphaerales bacterium]